MIFERTEYHQMLSKFMYDVPDQEIIDYFGAIDTFLAEMYDCTDQFYEFVANYDYQRVDDVWTDRKGNYDIEWDLVEELSKDE